jgi:hypothetical protein
MPGSTATLDEALETDRTRLHRGVLWRRAGTTVLVLILLAALGGWFGLRTATKQASQGAVTTRLHYAQITRRGVDTPWDLDVNRQGGLGDDVTVRVSLSYLDLLDQHAISPQPDTESTSGDMIEWTFSKPPGDTFHLRLDAEASPSAPFGRHHANTSIRVGSDETNTSFSTWIMP